jgi:hypothetical protein
MSSLHRDEEHQIMMCLGDKHLEGCIRIAGREILKESSSKGVLTFD